MYFVLVMNC